MRYLTVRFLCRLLTDASFSDYKGSMLRGALGSHLRRALCVTGKAECAECMLRATCIFTRIFTVLAENDQPGKQPLRPPPFCIEPDLDHRTEYKAGEEFGFTLKLFSYATDYLPYFAHAFTLAGKRGMGRREPPGRFAIADILYHGRPIYSAAEEKLELPDPDYIALPRLCDENGENRLLIRFLTPLRFKTQNKYARSMDFSALLGLVIRRMRALESLEENDFRMSDTEYRALMDAASQIGTVEARLAWKDWNRYSNHQQSAMNLGGIIGDVEYTGSCGKFRKFCDYAALTHLGKQTAFGLGQIEYEAR